MFRWLGGRSHRSACTQVHWRTKTIVVRTLHVCFMCDLAMGFVLCCVVMCPLFHLRAFICLSTGTVAMRSRPRGACRVDVRAMVSWSRSVHASMLCPCIIHIVHCRLSLVRLSFVCGCQCALVRCVVVICAMVKLFNFMCHVCDCHLRGHVIVRLSFVRLGLFNLICHMCDCHFCDVSVTL